MSIRRSSLIALAALATVAVAGPSFAGEKGGVPLVSNNTVVATNVAAGIGNTAKQDIFASQRGGGMKSGPMFGSNSIFADNTAAGIGNKAKQTLDVHQRAPKGVFGSNTVDARNLAAGIGNYARQDIYARQR
ncbi:MAG: hypothetical protein H3C38_15885 [Rhodospirillales bacterium]|nr:hypothetical protein [Rhodospirillales bacterium]